MMKLATVFLMTLFFGYTASAQVALPENELIWNSKTQTWLSLEQFRLEIAAGDVIVLGEQHAADLSLSARVHHSNQLRLLQTIGMSNKVSLGMEFFAYPEQNAVDLYVTGHISETEFLNEVKWGGNTFALYRPQVFAPQANDGRTLALNIPRSISGKVGRSGPDSLTAEEKTFLPPIWEQGSAEYFERFSEVMKGHVSDQQLANYFWAQSLWDDTMAWKSAQHRLLEPEDVLVVLVGEFHVEFGHGLPSRMIRHGVSQVKTVVQTEVGEWTEAGLEAAAAPHAVYGPRADYIWVYKLPAGE